MTFRGKQWKRIGNHYNLVGTKINVYQWNSGAKANFLVEKIGLPPWEQNTWTISGTGQEARDRAIAKAFELAESDVIKTN